MAQKERIGTIDESSMFGYDKKGNTPNPPASAAASGLKEVDSSPAYWFVGLIGVLLFSRVIWEYAGKS
jgi:hypothetical protein